MLASSRSETVLPKLLVCNANAVAPKKAIPRIAEEIFLFILNVDFMVCFYKSSRYISFQPE